VSAVRLHVECDGSGPSLVLAHGFAGSARNWRPQVRALADTHRICRFDARGHARSEAPDDPAAYSLDTFVDDFDAVATQAGSEPIVAGGLSLGAVIALGWAAKHPARVRGIVLMALPGDRRSGRGFGAVADEFADAILREGIDAAGERYVWGPRSGLDPAAAKLVRQGFLEHPPHGLANTLRGVLAGLPDPVTFAHRLFDHGTPALVIAGSRDEAAVSGAEAVAAVLPHAEVAIVRDAGHVVNLERSAEVSARVRTWLGTLARSR